MLDKYSSEQLLAEIITRHNRSLGDAPKCIAFHEPQKSLVVCIGRDNVADIIISENALEILEKRTNKILNYNKLREKLISKIEKEFSYEEMKERALKDLTYDVDCLEEEDLVQRCEEEGLL